ncbi:hypothetical protein KJ903_02905, partial [Patescibacteria group bacterium]|nr:hypothetical protein [Patescibacteria group bacterium]
MSKIKCWQVCFFLLLGLSGIFLLTADDVQAAATYYVRPGGGNTSQCNGTTNADYPGSGTGQNCAFSHPFYVFPPGGTSLLTGGDTLIIANGSYQIGLGAPNSGACSSSYPYDCVMPAIPSGPSSDQPTRILGEEWDGGCATKPELHGVERIWQVMDLTGSDNVELQCLEITDRSSCIESHSGDYTCERDTYPYGEWASVGLIASDSEDVLLKNIDIHGLAHSGVHAGRLQNWTIEDSNISKNGWVGWDGDINTSGQNQNDSSNSGQLIFRRVHIDYNGCGEDQNGNPVGCWAQTAGGYGDGLGTEQTAGDWTFEDSTFLYNTSDGLDLLYHRLGGSVTIRRTHAEGNAGQQIKATGNVEMINNVIVGNCGYFDNQSFTYNVDSCRAGGTSIALYSNENGSRASMYNNSIYSEGDCLVVAETSGVAAAITSRNNIFYGDVDYTDGSGGDRSCLLWSNNESLVSFDNDYSLVYGAKEGSGYLCSAGGNNLCSVDPLFAAAGFNSNTFDLMLQSGSPAIDVGTATGAPDQDFAGYVRPYGNGYDMGAYEYGSTERRDDDTDTDTDTDDTDTDSNPIPGSAPGAAIVTGAGYSGGPQVRVFSTSGRVYSNPSKLFAYDSHIRSGVKVTTGDLNGDGIDEIITGTGSGGGPHIRIFTKEGNL